MAGKPNSRKHGISYHEVNILNFKITYVVPTFISQLEVVIEKYSKLNVTTFLSAISRLYNDLCS